MSARSRILVMGYLLATFLVVVPLADTLDIVRPIDLESLLWRFGALGYLSRALDLPFLGVFIALSCAAAGRRTGVIKGIGIAMVAVALGLSVASAGFASEYLSTRDLVGPEGQMEFALSGVIALGKYGAGLIVAMVISWVCLRHKQKRSRTRRVPESA